jgi:hypothetical protein
VGAVDSRPLLDLGHQVLLDPVREVVGQAVDLGGLFVADHDGLVAARPDPVGPAGQVAHLTGQIAVEVPHEEGKLPGVADPEEEVKMRRQEAKAHDFNRIVDLGAPEGAEDDSVELLGRTQEEASLDGAAGDLDESPAVGHKAQMATHAH